MGAFLLIEGPGVWAYQHPLKDGKPVLIGRAPKCEVKLNDSSISGRHAQLIPTNGQWVLRDNQSSNGTFVNGNPIVEVTLRHGDSIKIGKVELAFNCPSDATEEGFLDRTQVLFTQQAQALRGVVRQAEGGGAVNLPTPVPHHPIAAPQAPPPPPAAHTSSPAAYRPSAPPAPAPAAPATPPVAPAFSLPDVESEEPAEDFQFNPDRYTSSISIESSPAPPAPPTTERGDLLWVAEKTADMLVQLATLRGKSRNEFFASALESLREIIGAENGFLMIADKARKRWVIRSWVGDSSEWTSVEKKNPVPLSVANQAYKGDRIVSNALDSGDDHANSRSMIMLSVHSYIAVPLHGGGEKQGVLYFDTRRSRKRFAPRDAKLIERIGAHLLQIEPAKR